LKKLVEKKVISRGERVVCIITGHQLKAANTTVGYHALHGEDFKHEFDRYGVKTNRFANAPVQVPNDLNEILKALEDKGQGSWDA